MQIELSQSEMTILEQALDCWEKDASTGAMMGGLFSLMLSPKDERDNAKNAFKSEQEKALSEGQRRKRVSTLLRAKIYQAAALASEHEI
jgi:patatin-like phospholipase/acyl hydrolase